VVRNGGEGRGDPATFLNHFKHCLHQYFRLTRCGNDKNQRI